MATILTYPDERLRLVSEPVEIGRKLRNTRLLSNVRNLIELMREKDGAGIAAPQVGWPVQICIVELPAYNDALVIFNPEIIWFSPEKAIGVEGCLSVPGKMGRVERSTAVKVTCTLTTAHQVMEGKGKPELLKRVIDAEADPGRAMQHEIDHLRGILYIDKAIKVWDAPT